MIRAEILATGDEILTGKIVDTNSNLIIRRLQAAGIPVRRTQTCGDDESELVMAMNAATATADLLVVVGGLGPTDDDRTAAVAARVFGRALKLDAETLEWLKARFAAYHIPYTPNNEKQAYFPEGATILDNPMGTARGFAVEREGRLAVFLPGPPRELAPMMDQSVVPLAREFFKLTTVIRPLVFKTFGMTESQLDAQLAADPFTRPGCVVGIRAKFPEIHVHVTIEADDPGEVDALEGEARAWVDRHLGPIVFSTDPTVSLEDAVVKALADAGRTLAVAESCTGGMIAQMVTNVSGSSDVFDRGMVTYSNEAKAEMLGVDPQAIEAHGAVSEQVAVQMAEGALARSNADIAAAVTGVAGPTGGSADKPVGTVYIAVADGQNSRCRRFQFRGNRTWVRTLTAYATLDAVRRTVEEEDPWKSSAYLSRWQSRTP